MSKHPDLTDVQLRRIAQLASEGMPKTWIAEDIGVRATQLKDIHLSKDDIRAWQSVWAGIRHHKNLADLHRQFAPKNS